MNKIYSFFLFLVTINLIKSIVVNKTLFFEYETIPSDEYQNSNLFSYKSILENSTLSDHSVYDGEKSSIFNSTIIKSEAAILQSKVHDSNIKNSDILSTFSFLQASIIGSKV